MMFQQAGERTLMICRHAFGGFGSALLVTVLLISSPFSLSDASAQDRRTQHFRTIAQPEMRAPAPIETVAAAPAPAPAVDMSTPFGAALSACDKAQQEDGQYGLPGLKGEIALDRCYRGRRQLVCRFDAFAAEGKALMDEFTRIVEERYPDVGNIEGICKIGFDALVRDLAGTVEFNKRFSSARAEYDARTGCAGKVKQSIQDLALTDLVQGQEVQKSMTEAVDQEIARVSMVQEQVSGLAGNLQASQKAIAALQKLHRAMCLNSNPTPAQSQAAVQ
jgi:hypothetical protein